MIKTHASLLEKMAMADRSGAGRLCVDVDPLEAHDDGSRTDYHRICKSLDLFGG